VADERIQITAQVVGCKTLKAAGGLRVEIDCFEANETDVATMAILANRRVVAQVTFEGIRDGETKAPGKKAKRKPGGTIDEK
jgi:hypothetical protein